ncbi:MAG: type II secretion system protein GspG [Chthoniobacterales bacterium]|nr:type II secretion system protein GspG [Chthoniobacterales bacterium]
MKLFWKSFFSKREILGRVRGFTLIELLITIAIISILAGIVLAGASYAQNRGLRSRAESEIKALETAIENYKADNGTYPQAANSQALRAALMPSEGKIYFEFTKSMTPPNANPSDPNQPILDPWKNEYQYRFPGEENRNGKDFFDLWSTAGGETDEAKWIKNW